MIKKIILATGNKNKVKEIGEIIKEKEIFGVDVISMKEAGISSDPEENGETFLDNAKIKAEDLFSKLSDEDKSYTAVLSDDSGLEIDFLNKEPGVHSARFMGHDTSYDIKNEAILKKLSGVGDDKRSARFVCAVYAVLPGGEHESAVCTMEGKIAHEISGENGFGYDPIFIPDGYDVTSADISPEEKNKISHRGKAFREIFKKLFDN